VTNIWYKAFYIQHLCPKGCNYYYLFFLVIQPLKICLNCKQIYWIDSNGESSHNYFVISGMYWIDPNGGSAQDAVQVHCNIQTRQTCITAKPDQVAYTYLNGFFIFNIQYSILFFCALCWITIFIII